MRCPLLTRDQIHELLQRADHCERLIVEGDLFRDLCLQAFAATQEQSIQPLIPTERLRLMLAGIEAAGAVDLPAERLRLFCRQALWALHEVPVPRSEPH
jgi:hypothetical protein